MDFARAGGGGSVLLAIRAQPAAHDYRDQGSSNERGLNGSRPFRSCALRLCVRLLGHIPAIRMDGRAEIVLPPGHLFVPDCNR